MVATALHSIVVGNMMPTYYTDQDGELQEITTLCVDQTEFLVSKLKDRGTHQAFGVVTNAQDFMRLLQLELHQQIKNLKETYNYLSNACFNCSDAGLEPIYIEK